MTDRPIAFTDAMICALREGRKTQTRRLVMSADEIVKGPWNGRSRLHETAGWQVGMERFNIWKRVPVNFAVGDRLWVKETYYQRGDWIEDPTRRTKGGAIPWCFRPVNDEIMFEKPFEFISGRRKGLEHITAIYKRLGRFMPRRYSRMTLIVTDVRVQRLQDISREDAIAEGIHRLGDDALRWEQWTGAEGQCGMSPVAAYGLLWNSINGPGSWDANPWVVAITFEVDHA